MCTYTYSFISIYHLKTKCPSNIGFTWFLLSPTAVIWSINNRSYCSLCVFINGTYAIVTYIYVSHSSCKLLFKVKATFSFLCKKWIWMIHLLLITAMHWYALHGTNIIWNWYLFLNFKCVLGYSSCFFFKIIHTFQMYE